MSQISIHNNAVAAPEALNAPAAMNAPQASMNANHAPAALLPADAHVPTVLADVKQRLSGILQQGIAQNPSYRLFRDAKTSPLLPIPDASATPALRKAQQKVTAMAEKVHTAFNKLNGINLSKLALRCDDAGKLVLPKNVREARDTVIKALFALNKSVKEYEQHGTVTMASANLRDTCLSKAAEVGTLFNKLRLEGLQKNLQSTLNDAKSMNALSNAPIGAVLQELADIRSSGAYRPYSAPQSAVWGIRALATTMHGTPQFINALAANPKLSQTLHTLVQGKDDLSGPQLENCIKDIDSFLEDMREMIESMHTNNTLTPNTVMDMLNGLKAVKKTLTELPKAEPRVAYWEQANLVLKFPSITEYSDIVSLLPQECQEALTKAAEGITVLRKQMAEQISYKKLTTDSLKQMESTAQELCSTTVMQKPMALASLLRHMTCLKNLSGAGLNSLLPRLVMTNLKCSEQEARTLVNQALKILADCQARGIVLKARTFCDEIRNTALLRGGGLQEGFTMLHQKLDRANNMHMRSDMLAAVFTQPLNVDIMVDTSLRGFNPDFVELTTNNLHLAKKEILGEGAANTVYKCLFRAPDGTAHVRIFKPEEQAREGLTNLLVADFGYFSWSNSTMHNVATCIVAQQLDCEDSVVKSTVGSVEGKVGLFMEEAQGFTPHQLASNKPLFAYDGNEGSKVSFRELIEHMKSSGKWPTVHANLAKELNKLEWLDLLCAQADRHRKNYMIDINPNTGSVKVKGIDNDASFGYRMTGIARVDMHNGLEFSRLSRVQNLYELAKGLTDNQLPLLHLSDKAATEARSTFGIHQLGDPHFMDKDVYQRIHDLDVREYRQALQGTLPELALNAAVARLENAKILAQTMLKEGRIITDWASTDVQKFYASEAEKTNLLPDSKPYFVRDMAEFE